MTVDLHVKTFALSLVLLAGGIATFAKSTGPTYAGRKHTYSHGGTYAPAAVLQPPVRRTRAATTTLRLATTTTVVTRATNPRSPLRRRASLLRESTQMKHLALIALGALAVTTAAHAPRPQSMSIASSAQATRLAKTFAPRSRTSSASSPRYELKTTIAEKTDYYFADAACLGVRDGQMSTRPRSVAFTLEMPNSSLFLNHEVVVTGGTGQGTGAKRAQQHGQQPLEAGGSEMKTFLLLALGAIIGVTALTTIGSVYDRNASHATDTTILTTGTGTVVPTPTRTTRTQQANTRRACRRSGGN